MAQKKKHKTYNISSSRTVFFKYFLPLIWVVFFGTLMVVFMFADQFKVGSMTPQMFKIVYCAFFFSIVAVMYFTIFKLKRVELDEDYVYITNYFKIYRYPYSNIEKVVRKDYGMWETGTVHLKEAGHFGQKSNFMIDKKKFAQYFEMFPEQKDLFGVE